MSKGRKPGKDGGNVTEMPSETNNAEEITETTETSAPGPTEAAEAPTPTIIADPERGRRKTLTLFDRVRQIPKADWGIRAFIYVYCLEPICDLKMGGEKKYLVKSKEPILDEDSIMMDYGSGKYRLQLVYRKPAADKADQIDVCEIEIYNPKYPPKIPQSVWMNDPRNARWLALIPPKEEPKPDTPMGSITETFKVFSDMRKDVRDELKPVTTTSTQDPLDMAQKILNIQQGSNNPMVQLFQTQMQMFEKAAEEGRKREADLQKELREQLRAQNTPTEKSDPIETLVKAADKLQPLIEKFMPKAVEAAAQVTRARRPGLTELLMEQGLPILGKILEPWSAVLAARMMQGAAPANGYAPNPVQPGQPQAPGIASPAQPQIPPQQARLIQFLTQPLVLSSFNSHFTDFRKDGDKRNPDAGEDFAYWILKSGGEQPLIDARAMGTTNILALFKASPAWPTMAPHEAKLTAFLDQVLSWKPEAIEPDDDNEDETVTDLTAASA